MSELLIQKDMNKFYEYLNDKNFTEYRKVNELTGFDHCYVKAFAENKGDKDAERLDVSTALGNFNYQVENGGIHQWVYNNYYMHGLPILLEFLPQVMEYYKEDSSEYKLAKLVLDKLTEIANEDYLANEWTIICDECDGSGQSIDEEGELTHCYECDGTGHITVHDFTEVVSYLLEDNFDSKFYKFDTVNIFNKYIENIKQIQSKKEPVVKSDSKLKVKLLGEDGNIFTLIGIVSKAMLTNKVDIEIIKKFQEEATKSTDYNEALQVIMKYVDIF